MPRRKKPEPKRHERSWGAGTVKEVRPGVWRAWQSRVRRPDGQSVRPSRTFVGKDAEAYAKRWAAGDPEPAVMYVGQWLERWLALREPRLRVRTRESYRGHIAACGDLLLRPIHDVTEEDWQVHTNDLMERWPILRVRNWRSTIRSALRAAVPRYLAVNPMQNVQIRKIDEKVIRSFTADELAVLIRGCAGTRYELWVHLSVSTGIRLGESRGLTWDKFDLVEKTILIDTALDQVSNEVGPTKNGKIRTVDIPDELIPMLREQRARQHPSERYVIGHSRKGGPINAGVIRSWIVTRCRLLGIRQLGPHALRHTFATHSLDAGVALKEVSETLGHANVGITSQVYSHSIRRRRRHAANVMGQILSGAVSEGETAPTPLREVSAE